MHIKRFILVCSYIGLIGLSKVSAQSTSLVTENKIQPLLQSESKQDGLNDKSRQLLNVNPIGELYQTITLDKMANNRDQKTGSKKLFKY